MSAATPPGQPPQINHHAHQRIVPRHVQPPPPPGRSTVFRNLNPGERLVWVRRQSHLFLLATGAPLMLAALVLLLLHVWLGNNLPAVVEIIGVALLGIFVLHWLISDLWNWFFQFYVLTDQRVIKSRGYFNRQRDEIPISSIAQVRAEVPNIFYAIFNIGNVAVRPIGPEIELTGMANARDAADSILAIMDDPRFGLPPANAPGAPGGAPGAPTAAGAPGGQMPPLRNKKLQDDLNEMAQPDPLPAVGPPIVKAPFISFFFRKIPIRYLEGESIVEVVYRHWAILVKDEIIAIGLLIVGVGIGLFLDIRGDAMRGNLILAAGIGVAVVVGLLVYVNWADDVFILTTHRVIDIDRLFYILAEYSNDAPYSRIQEVRVNRNIVGKALGFGSIEVSTAGRKSALNISSIPKVFQIMDRIFEQRNQQKERDSIIAANKQKQTNLRWASVVAINLMAPVPDLRGIRVVQAMGQARQAGFKVTGVEERAAPGVVSGTVLDQTPTPGSVALPESDLRLVVAGPGGGGPPP